MCFQSAYQGTSLFSFPHSTVNYADVIKEEFSVKNKNLLGWRRRRVMVRRCQAKSVA